jgi:gliding motility-associated-like protein
MRPPLTILFAFFSVFAKAQSLPYSFPKTDSSTHTKIVPAQLRTMEECSNGIDDDGNGLRDCEDYACYFNNSSCNCVPSNTVWMATSNGKLYWINVQSGQESFIGILGTGMTDITWTSDGKLYGLTGPGVTIYGINPANAQSTFIVNVPGYFGSNAMTCDNQGNLYIAATISGSGYRVLKYNIASGQQQIVANLTSTGLSSGGDLAFLNGYLYLACVGNLIAKIDVTTGSVQSFPIQGMSSNVNVFGIVSTADGSLYLSTINSLYRLNVATMTAVLAYTCTSFNDIIYGMSNYNDNCNAVPCSAKVTITNTSNPPFCVGQGSLLQSNGSGLGINATYKWTLPDGSVVAGQSVNALQNGKYKVTYSEDAVCKAVDSLFITLEGPPALDLGVDKKICPGGSLLLQNLAPVTGSYLWQDGSQQSSFAVTDAGLYWTQLTGACGVSRDSIIVTAGQTPKADIGPDILICPYDETLLNNFLHDAAYAYTWNTGSTGSSIMISQPGVYWVNVKNSCGATRDTVIVGKKPTECDCFLYVPTAFTPNSDGKNDEFRVNSNCRISGELLIYNRWGQLVFRSRNLAEGWDGRVSSKLQANAVYVYLLNYRFRNYPVLQSEKGSFLLIH